MNSINYDLYKLAEGRFKELLKEEKENTPLAEKWSEEMDYWWKRLTLEERKEIINSSKKELKELFSKSFKI